MNGSAIIRRVAQKHRISVDLLRGPLRWRELVAARAEAIAELTAAGMGLRPIARLLRRDHATIRYWQNAELRAKRRAAYQVRSYAARGNRPPSLSRLCKTTNEQRRQILDLYAAGDRAAVYAMQEQLGLHEKYAQRIALKHGVKAPARLNAVSPKPVVQGRPKPVLRAAAEKLSPERQVSRTEPEPRIAKPSPTRLAVQPLLDDAKRRASAKQSITAAAFGDPVPGRSALDMRTMNRSQT